MLVLLPLYAVALSTGRLSALNGKIYDCYESDYSCTNGTDYAGVAAWGYPGPHNCTLYAAYRLAQNGYSNPNGLGNAYEWDENASARQVVVDTTPAVGSIAQHSDGAGHVMYVEAVNNDHIVITEDNWGGGTGLARITKDSAEFNRLKFIHFKDVVATNNGSRFVLAGLNTNLTANNIFSREQVDTNGNWQSAWTNLSGAYGEIDAATTTDGRQAIVALNTQAPAGSNNVYVRKQVDTYGNWQSGWTALSGHLTKVSAAFDGSNRLIIAGVNGTGGIFVRREVDTHGNWQSSWTPLSGYATDLDVVTTSDGKAGIAAINTNVPAGSNNIFIRKQADTYGNWQASWTPLSGYLTKISAAYDGDGKMTIAGLNTTVSTNNVLVRKQADIYGNWGGWTNLSGRYDDLDIMTTSDGKTGIAAIDTSLPNGGSNNVFVRKQVDTIGNWESNWTSLSGYLTKISAAKH